MSEHTPRPWNLPITKFSTFYGAAEAIAMTHPRGYTDEMVAANARLMLASPELLELIEQTVETCRLLSIALPRYTYTNSMGGTTKQQGDPLLDRMIALLAEVRS